MIKTFYRTLIFFVFPAVLSAAAFLPADELDPALKEKADKALQAVDETIMSLHSGVCRIWGKTVEGSEAIEDDIYLLFDADANYYRFENGDLKRALLNKDYYYEVWAPADPDGRSVRRSSSSDYTTTSTGCRIVDPLGLIFFTPGGNKRPFNYRESTFHAQNRDIEKIGYEEIEPHIFKVTTIEPPGDAKWKFLLEYHIDTQRGYTVNHIDMTALGLTDCSIRHVHDITWKNINDTWVPTTYAFKSFNTGINPDEEHRRVNWKIEWESVNEAVDPGLFELETMLADLDGYAATFTNEPGSSPALLGVHELSDSFENPRTRFGVLLWFRILILLAGTILVANGLRKLIISRRAEKTATSEDDPPVS